MFGAARADSSRRRPAASGVADGQANAPSRDLSVVVVAHNMSRELPRTLFSLSRTYQQDVAHVDYELIVVDNASASPADLSTDFGVPLRELAGPGGLSPARAANLGISAATGRLVTVILDGARLVTPGLISTTVQAAAAYPQGAFTPLAFHLGPEHQSRSVANGYSREVEDELLDSCDWMADGYRLYDIACLAGSNPSGWFGPLNESCALTMSKERWAQSGGFDESFQEPGGGLVSLDLFERVLRLADMTLVVLLGEGSFHQIHGGASTSAAVDRWPAFSAEYQALRGQPYELPDVSPRYVGRMPTSARAFLGVPTPS